MIQRHEIQVLLKAGMSHRQVAKQTGISKRTVTRIAQESAVEAVDTDLEVRRRGIGRPKRTNAFEERIQEILEADRSLPTVEILHRLKQAGYRGGKSAVYDLVRQLRGPTSAAVMVRFEGIAGEFAQFDFGQVQIRYPSGETQKLHFACYRLKYSRWVHVEITPNEQVEPLCRALLRAFEKSGGVPLAVVFDYVSGHIIDNRERRNAAKELVHPHVGGDPLRQLLTFARLRVGEVGGTEDADEDLRLAHLPRLAGDDGHPLPDEVDEYVLAGSMLLP
jgi:transposase